MLDTLSYKLDLWKLRRKKDRLGRSYQKDIDKARKEKKPHDDIEMLMHEDIEQSRYMDDDIAQRHYRRLCNQAEKYFIATPKYNQEDGTWEQSDISGRWRFSRETTSNLRNAIRQDEKYRREHWQGWLTALTGLFAAIAGTIAALVGLVSVLPSA